MSQNPLVPEVVTPEESDRRLPPATPAEPPAPRITSLSSEHQVLDDEITRITNALEDLDAQWAETTHPEEKCKLALTQLKIMEFRRKAMKLSFGGPTGVGRPSGRDAYYDD